MDGFTFYVEYYETIKKVKKQSDRQALLAAIVEFVFEDKEPQGLSEVAEIVFETFRKKLTKSKNKSENAKIKSKSNQNQSENNSNQNENKSNESKNLISVDSDLISVDFTRESPLKEVPLNEKERSKEKENIYPEENNPQENVQRACARVEADGRTDGQGEDKAQAEFFTLYPKIRIDNYSPSDYAGIDFELLIRRFEESEFLRDTHSFSWLCKNYPKIAAGGYRDFEKRKTKDVKCVPLGEEWADLE